MVPSIVAALRDRPGMLLSPATYETFIAYLLGYDRALDGGLLVGFREWLVVRLGDGNNLAWPALVDSLRERQKPIINQSDDGLARSFLLGLLDSYFVDRNSTNGLRLVFVRYNEWVERQSWYGPSSPQWIAPSESS